MSLALGVAIAACAVALLSLLVAFAGWRRVRELRRGQQASGADGLLGHPRNDGDPVSVLFAHRMNLLELRRDALCEAGVRRARGGEAAVDHPGEGFDPSPSEISLQPRCFRDGGRFREGHQ